MTAGKIYEQNNWNQPTEVASILESILESIIMIGWGGDVSETDPPYWRSDLGMHNDPGRGAMAGVHYSFSGNSYHFITHHFLALFGTEATPSSEPIASSRCQIYKDRNAEQPNRLDDTSSPRAHEA